MDASELQTYEAQLGRVNDALSADPSNAELLTLKEELVSLIDLTKSLFAESTASGASNAAASSSSSSKASQPQDRATSQGKASPSVGAGPSQPKSLFSAGEECMARYKADGRWYPARITSVGGSSQDPVYSIIFKGYKTTEMVRSHEVRSTNKPRVDGSSNDTTYAASSSDAGGGPAGKRRSSPTRVTSLGGGPEDDPSRKKSRSSTGKNNGGGKNQLVNKKANSWQKFATKAQKKGKIPTGEKSIFATSDDPLARVGVTGGGRGGMTSYQDRAKHVYK